jgi:hypothetical protein
MKGKNQYADQIALLPGTVAPVAHSLAAEIGRKVQTIRDTKAEIADLRQTSGIAELESGLDTLRSELLPLAQEYRDIVGANWQDETGFAQYREPGERNSFETDQVDQVFAALVALQTEMESLSSDVPLTFSGEGYSGLTVSQMVGNPLVSREELEVALSQLSAIHLSTVQEMIFRIEAMGEHLSRLGSARKTSPIKESIAVS